ncbi:unnamed protein product [Urochloa humidicola]
MMSPFELAAAAGVLILFLYAAVTNRHRRKLPPSPPSLPLLGHLHLIGRLAHRSLHELQLRYGGGGGDGLLLLQLGRRRTPVVSTAAAAADLFRNHDLAFASRPRSTNADKLMYGAGEEEEDFVDVLLRLRREGADGLELTDERIKATVKNMIIAATETSSHTLEWAMAELVANPRVMARLQDEIARVAAAAADNDEPAIAEAELSKMEYLRAVFKEVLRLHAPAPLLVPHESTTPAVVQGYEIPAKTALGALRQRVGHRAGPRGVGRAGGVPAGAVRRRRRRRWRANGGLQRDGLPAHPVRRRPEDLPGDQLRAADLGARACRPPEAVRLGAPRRHAPGGPRYGRGAGADGAAAGSPCANPQVQGARSANISVGIDVPSSPIRHYLGWAGQNTRDSLARSTRCLLGSARLVN